ncbi:hypothetical protein MO867_06935 [Microbulbifer sp. OS29]|uniref:Patatin-like phospholipase n=1 Tax=Microbulbifer okhotskensis TaxID=2926617 RepID=A0A9X2EM27_9GAMM|nr:hypothetical protein [Microbulbifer okhotskensis]MCO1334075.1 hypothetical protein [Microbulbifer okhotskensis]
MKSTSCILLAGATAARRIREQGLDQKQFSTLVGASGGPKWLAISQLDRVLMGEFFKGRNSPIATLGSSIGSFRNMCYAMANPLAALERLEGHYIQQSYSVKPAPEEITAGGRKMLLEVLGRGGAREVVENPVWHSHFVTVRGRGPLASEKRALLAPALFASAIANVVSRNSLSAFWERVVFHTQNTGGIQFQNLSTINIPLTEKNTSAAVLASGCIPLVMAGVQTPLGAPEGNYRDGGITDYHFDLRFRHPEGLVLYPHFFPYMVPGWFDKGLSWRRVRGDAMRSTLVVAPSPKFVASLPFGKIPDRNDFYTLDQEERLKYWGQVVDLSRRVADDFYEIWQSGRAADYVIEVGADDIPHKLEQVRAT